MSHVRNKLVEVLHRFVYVYLPSPFAFLDMSASCRAVSGTERCESRALGTVEGFVDVAIETDGSRSLMSVTSHRFPSFR